MMRLALLLGSVLALALAAPAAFAGGNCDADANGTCEQADVELVQSLQGAAAGDADYLASADLDDDGQITLHDLTMAMGGLAAK